MMKRILSLTVLLLLLFVMVGCAAEEPKNTTAPTTTAPTETTEATEPIDYTQYYGPWEYDVAAKAKEEGKLHYYFMSNEGIVIKPDGGASTYKWGDSCLIAFPNGQTMLIDSGLYKTRQILIGNLQQMGIKTLDYLVITHPHGDHQGGAIGTTKNTSEFMDLFEVKQAYYVKFNNPTSEEDELVERVCAEKNVPAKFLEQGDSLDVGDVKITVLWPVAGTNQTTVSGTPSVNNTGLVLHFAYGEHSSLFTADLYQASEMFCVNGNDAALIDVDLLKVPHHGHKTSSSDRLLEATSPELAVATGSLNISTEIRDRYAQYNIPLVYNYINGYIHVSVDTDGIMETETTRNDTPDAVVEEGAIGD